MIPKKPRGDSDSPFGFGAVAWGRMKNIDVKSLLIGALLTSTIFLGVAATSKDDKGKWDDTQVWSAQSGVGDGKGWEPFGLQ